MQSVDINTNQVVAKALTAYLEASDEVIVGWELNTRSNSPFYGKVTRQRRSKDQLFALHW